MGASSECAGAGAGTTAGGRTIRPSPARWPQVRGSVGAAMSTDDLSGEETSRFDRFVEAAHAKVSRAPFFAICGVVIVGWLVSYPLFSNPQSWQAVIHTITSVTTLLLVALLENAGRRDAKAAQEKLSTLTGALADLMDARGTDDPHLKQRAAELREAIGVEERTST